jgi:hypothetical protein
MKNAHAESKLKLAYCGDDCNACERVVDAFRQTDAYAGDARDTCSAGEYELLHEAFFAKRERLDRINRKMLSSTATGTSDHPDDHDG